jgi:hypothetical protein
MGAQKTQLWCSMYVDDWFLNDGNLKIYGWPPTIFSDNLVNNCLLKYSTAAAIKNITYKKHS